MSSQHSIRRADPLGKVTLISIWLAGVALFVRRWFNQYGKQLLFGAAAGLYARWYIKARRAPSDAEWIIRNEVEEVVTPLVYAAGDAIGAIGLLVLILVGILAIAYAKLKRVYERVRWFWYLASWRERALAVLMVVLSIVVQVPGIGPTLPGSETSFDLPTGDSAAAGPPYHRP